MPKLIVIMFGIILGAAGAGDTSSVAATPARSVPTIGATQVHSTSIVLAKCPLRRYRRPHLQG